MTDNALAIAALPQFVYKYLPRRFAIKLITGQSMRIGTLADFRKVEDHGAQRGDAEEGARTLYEVANGPATPFMEKYFVKGPGVKTAKFENIEFQQKFLLDAYVYCTSLSCSRRTMALFNDADTCVRISHPVEFLHGVAKELIRDGARVEHIEMDRVTYGERRFEVAHEPAQSGVYYKDPVHAPQQEFRMFWVSPVPPTGPRNIPSHRLAKYCSFVKDIAE